MSKDKPCLKLCYDLGFHSPNRSESDLSNEVLYILVGQEAAKISEVKVGGQKKSARSRGPRTEVDGGMKILLIKYGFLYINYMIS